MRRRAGSAPPDDLAAFYADQYHRLRGALTLFTGDPRLAEELAQEAFVRTCQHWEKVRAMEAPAAWVHRVGINLAISGARRRRTERRAVDGATDLGPGGPPTPAERRPCAQVRIPDDEDLAALGIPTRHRRRPSRVRSR